MSLFTSCRFSTALLLCACMTVSGCTVGPNYLKPGEWLPGQWTEKESKGIVYNAPPEITHWWTVFNDPVLNELIEQSVKANKDLKVASERVREARAQRVVAVAGLWPTLDASAAYSFSRGSSNASKSPLEKLPPGLVAPGYDTPTFQGGLDLFQAGFDASWELDLFGRVRRSVEAATADLEASQENYRGALVSLLAEVAVDYLAVRGSQLRLEIALKNIDAQRQTVELTRERFQAGLSSDLDVSQATAQLATTESLVPSLETAARQSMYRLATLLGTAPGDMVEKLSAAAPVPGIPPEVPVGLPSDLLRRRPDVRQAERQLAAETARIGVATADLFPRINLTGALGQSSINLAQITESASSFWSIGPTIKWNIFNAGSTRANIEAQKARTEQALATYEKAVLTSLQDVESALVAYSKEQTRRASLVAAVQANQHAYEISNELYARGLVDFLRVLDSQRSLYVTQDQLAASDQLVSSNLVALYKALGGGLGSAVDRQVPPCMTLKR